MILKYDIEVNTSDMLTYLTKLTNAIYKLLPSREEGLNWEKALSAILVELKGFNSLLSNHSIVLALASKLEGLLQLTNENDFIIYRGIVFDCLSLVSVLKTQIQQGEN